MSEIQLVPLPQAALRLGISWEKAWRLVLKGTLKGEQKGGRWMVSENSLRVFIAQRNRRSAEETMLR
jgi:hypothetical protein